MVVCQCGLYSKGIHISYTSPAKSYELYVCKGRLYEQMCVCPVFTHVLGSLSADHIIRESFPSADAPPPPCSMAGHLDQFLLSLCFLAHWS